MNTIARLFNGRLVNKPELKHITVDCYGNILLITTYNTHTLPPHFVEQFSSTVTYIYWRKRTGKNTSWMTLKGELLEQHIIINNKLKFKLRFGDRQNVGFFLDMENVRHYLQRNAKNKKVLNLFAYSCSLSVVAIAGGAQHVSNVDMKSTFLDWGKFNHQLNHHDLRKISFIKHNILKSLNTYIKRGPFDLIICDPPSFQPGGFKLQQDYPKILRRIAKMLNPQGEALLCCNDPLFSCKQFDQLIIDHGKNLRIIERIPNPPQFDGLQVVKVQCTS